jgi:hypothetical protein
MISHSNDKTAIALNIDDDDAFEFILIPHFTFFILFIL